MADRKIYIVGHGWGYANWMEGQQVQSMKDADLVVFTGGEDVSPELYGKQPHPATFFNRTRDRYEVEAFRSARELDKKIIGICRGAQFLCAMAGGTLVQHQRHPWNHVMNTKEGEIITTSTHHQRQFPWGGRKPRFELLGWTATGFSPFSQGEGWKDNMRDDKPEAEVVYYPDIKALAIQGHPEMAYPSHADWEKIFIQYCRTQLDRLMES